jgi:hypothetical protein
MAMTQSIKKQEFLAADLSELLKPFRSGWVALSSDQRRVVASAQTLREAREHAVDRSVPNAVFVKIIPPDQGYISLLQ